MATTTNTLPFGRTGAQAAGPSYTMQDLEGSMSMARMGLSFDRCYLNWYPRPGRHECMDGTKEGQRF
nr:truncated VP19 [White spot syndrome virus]